MLEYHCEGDLDLEHEMPIRRI